MEIKIKRVNKKVKADETIEELSSLLLVSPEGVEVDNIYTKEESKSNDDDSTLSEVLGNDFSFRDRGAELRNIMYTNEELKELEDREGNVDDGSLVFDADRFLGSLIDDDEESISDTIIGSQIKGHSKRKSDEDEFRKDFADEFTLLYDSLKDYDKLEKQIEKIVGLNTQNNRVRGASKYINDGITNLITLKNQRLSTIKEIVNLKKITTDLRFKSEKNAGEDVKGDMGLIGSNLIQQVLSSGRADLVDAIKGPELNAMELLQSDSPGTLNDALTLSRSTYSDDERNNIDDMISKRLAEEGNPGRSEEADKLIKYESVGAKVHVRRYIDSDEYEFVAVDKYGNEIYDYPVPDVDDSDVGELQFSGKIAVDRRGLQYRVEEVYENEDNNPESSGDYYKD